MAKVLELYYLCNNKQTKLANPIWGHYFRTTSLRTLPCSHHLHIYFFLKFNMLALTCWIRTILPSIDSQFNTFSTTILSSTYSRPIILLWRLCGFLRIRQRAGLARGPSPPRPRPRHPCGGVSAGGGERAKRGQRGARPWGFQQAWGYTPIAGWFIRDIHL